MIGTLINTGAILLGGALGVLMGGRLPERLRKNVVVGLGLFTLLYGIQMFLKTQNALVVLGSLLIGIILGEWGHIEEGLLFIGQKLEKRFSKEAETDGKSRFIKGFLVTSLLFCVGPMAILGSIQDGLSGDINTLVVKSILDLFASIAFASTLGVGVLFSALMVLLYQGSISLLAVQVQSAVNPLMMNEMTATGGVILAGLSIGSLLELREVRVGNMLPALFAAPAIMAVLALFGVKI
jgi:uncharacterized protein